MKAQDKTDENHLYEQHANYHHLHSREYTINVHKFRSSGVGVSKVHKVYVCGLHKV